jgi:zinc protease
MLPKLTIFALLSVTIAFHLHADSCSVLPFHATEKTLANGLHIVVVPTPFPRAVTLEITVQSGVREAVSPGTSAMPRVIERLLMSNGTAANPRTRYERTLAQLAARQTSSTTDDVSTFETTFVKDDLQTVLELEADRFQNLAFSSDDVRALASQILTDQPRTGGPLSLLFETQRQHAFRVHPYKHIASGSPADLEALRRDAGETKKFFARCYRPERTTLVIAGDVDPQKAIGAIEALWSGWKRGDAATAIPPEPASTATVFAHAAAPSQTPPWITIGFHAPAFSATSRDYAAFQLLMQLSFGSESELRRELLAEEEKVDYFGVDLPEDADPSMATIYARLIALDDMVRVRDRILTEVALRRHRAVDASRFALAQTAFRADFGATLDTTEAIARIIARFTHLGGDAAAVDRYACTLASVTPADLQEVAKRYLTNENMVTTTLASEALSPSLAQVPAIDSLLKLLPGPAAIREVAGDPSIIVQKSSLPELDIKIAFTIGSAHDPIAKYGLARLAASMVANGGSTQKTAAQIEDALRAMGGRWSVHVDRELTVFTGRVRTEQWSPFLDLVLPAIAAPAFDRYDLRRLKRQQIAALDDLRENPEELAKEVLQARAFQNGPYGHPSVGTTAGIKSITLDDVRDFIAQHYRAGNLVIGVSGDVPDALVARLRTEMAKLPTGGTPKLAISARPPLDVLVDAYRSPIPVAAISLGFPIDVNRTSADFAALSVVRSWFGEHRSPLSHLAQAIRDARGLNFGDYAYIEAFPNAAGRFVPEPNVVRRKQVFELWLRPVAPENAGATLRTAVYELRNLIRDGLTEEQFRTTRDFLMKNVETWAAGQDEQLGAAIDGHWYGIPDFPSYMRDQLKKLTLADVNGAIHEYLSGEHLFVAVVTSDVAKLRRDLTGIRAPVPKYDSPRSKAVMDEDAVIAGMTVIHIEVVDFRALPVSEAFAR